MHGIARRPRTSLSLLAAGLMLGACHTELGETPYGRNGVGAIQFKDLPVPAGFKLRDRYHESYSYEVPPYRHGVFVYRGSGSVADASAYLRARMPQHNWKLADEQTGEHAQKLLFRRGRDTARCVLSEEGGATRLAFHVTHRIAGPDSLPAPAESATDPKSPDGDAAGPEK